MHAHVSDKAKESTCKECLPLATEIVKLLPDFAVWHGMVAMRVYDAYKREAKNCMLTALQGSQGLQSFPQT